MAENLLLLKNKSVLIAEDDKIIRHQMIELLEMLFGRVISAKDGEEAYRLYEDESPDIIITDIKMPKKDGLKLAKQIRLHDYDIPIILLTSYSEKDMLISAANLSVDGYLVKPIELNSVVETICRAANRIHGSIGLLELGKDTYYNSATKELYHKGSPVPLSTKEHELLLFFIKHHNKTVTKDEIAECIWPLDPICDSAIKNLVLRLRKKLGFDLIISVRGIGYRLNIASARPSDGVVSPNIDSKIFR